MTRYNEIAFDALASFEKSVLSVVKTAAVKNLDETGFRVAGKTQWLHVASTKTATYYHVSPKRKSSLDGLSGTVIHDHWKSYYNLEGVEHALCNQHHLRELKAITDHGAEQFARIRGFISTVRKQGLSIISSIQSIFSGTIPLLSGI